MHGHPLVSGLLGQLEALERSARQAGVPLLAGQAEALRQTALALAAERAGLDDSRAQAVAKARFLERAIEENRRRYEESLRSFERFRQGFGLVESLRDLGELPALLESVRGLFRLAAVRLVLDEEEFGPCLPADFPVLPARELAREAQAVRASGRRSYVGPCSAAPGATLGRSERKRWGSCFLYPLEDRFREGRWAGMLLVADVNPGRYLPDMATDYMEHFFDSLAAAVTHLADRRKNEEMREDVERMARHDLKSPLSAVLTLPQFLIEAENLTERQRDMARLMLEAGRRMQSLITLSLSLYRMERGEYAPEPVALDLAALARAVWEECGGPWRSARMRLEIEAQEDPFVVQGEEILCYALFSNLIKNALEASSPGDAVTLRLLREPDWDVAEVGNRGDVPEQVRASFFRKYATFGKQSGTGLGTYTARLIARTHGGDVEMETGQGQGTVVRVRLPRSSDLP
ncbi:Sensor protein DivL [Fundidesulfovibrio magnetotacticus]|uniref:histidine kinase n=1 Tax=Fundidesulfovibrio magnetotacticus TaxID=2730080 RepID=A0A6V8LWX3_9BACT|nr:HAMP domain-containing sensor histidine kinase [Fundidesulfovibrio magnetotacticus]GFK94768.1 Sensor protein DivL [Fundidesulfovibrio magnetotacticus]